MMLEEFEKLAGYRVNPLEYREIIEPMYTAVALSKEEFVKVIDRKRFEIHPEPVRVWIDCGPCCYAEMISAKISVRTGEITYKLRPVNYDDFYNMPARNEIQVNAADPQIKILWLTA